MCAFGASVFFFNDTATTEIYTLSLHDALPISPCRRGARSAQEAQRGAAVGLVRSPSKIHTADCRLRQGETISAEHTSELESQSKLVSRLLLDHQARRPR